MGAVQAVQRAGPVAGQGAVMKCGWCGSPEGVPHLTVCKFWNEENPTFYPERATETTQPGVSPGTFGARRPPGHSEKWHPK